MLLNSLFLSALSLISGASAASAVNDLTSKTFDTVVNAGVPGLVEFYAPWCGHCKNLAPVYEELASAFAHAKDKVHISRVDADSERSLGNKFGIQGFPTLKWFDGESKEPVEEYSSGRDLESLSAFITEKTGVKAKGIKKPAVEKSDVVILDEKSFDEVIGGEKDVLVAFTAPWCGHCKRLAPIYESLATTFLRDPSVVIAKVDCEHPASKQLAVDQAIEGFPTIKFFPRGSKEAIDYAAPRDEESFVEFINEHAGTHRTVGGGLDEQGGLIEKLDQVLKGYNGKNIEKIAAKLKAAAEGIEDKYAAYYVRVAEKLSGNAGYVEKEARRLEKVIAKGSVSGEKLDDLVVRSNIVKKFVPSEVEETVEEEDEVVVDEKVDEKVEEKVEEKQEEVKEDVKEEVKEEIKDEL
ncbi:hypothetical protein KEM56_002956 [Ascosphaera pollenicola]|nr:hypothetical protein KEM56_002956 [Ascosphaera pollenicola]